VEPALIGSVAVSVTGRFEGARPNGFSRVQVSSANWLKVIVVRRTTEQPSNKLTPVGSKSFTREDVETWIHTGGHEARTPDGYEVSDSIAVPMEQVQKTWWPRLVAAGWTCITTSFATDYYAPLAVGVTPVVIAAVPIILAGIQRLIEWP